MKMRYRTGWDFPTLVRYIYYGWACARGSYCCSSIIISDGEDGIFLVGLEVYRIAVLALIGKMSLYQLPLHLCSMAGFLCCLHAFFKWDWLGQVLYTLCLPGTVLALLFPDWVRYSFYYDTGIYLPCRDCALRDLPAVAAQHYPAACGAVEGDRISSGGCAAGLPV